MHLNRREFAGMAGAAAANSLLPACAGASDITFAPELESLKAYEAPDWFRDAKLGFWACWGPEAVPEMGDWYARNMYIQGHRQYEDHLKRFGHPSKFGYKDLVPLWRGENWNPDRLMGLYKKAGGKYFCAIAQHHDNIDCWNSRFHSWNSIKMGPRRDVIGEWRDAARKHGLRFGVTEHLGASWNWFGVSKLADATGPLAGVPYDGVNPNFDELYHAGNAHRDCPWYRNTPESFQMEWFNRIKDLVDSYQPDLLYSDGSLPFGRYGRELLAHFYNSNIQRLGGRLEAVYNCKNNDDGGQFADGMCVQDLERGIQDGIKSLPWQTDTCVGDWYYKRDIQYKSPTTIIQMLIDIVSKNGNLLLNFPVRADGTLDSQEEDILANIASWMAINTEAIHGTRPWRVYGEGPTGPSSGNFNEGKIRYTSDDIRFTAKDGQLFAFALAWPTSCKLLLRSITSGQVHSVQMLQTGEPLKWEQQPAGLFIQLPAEPIGEHAYGLRIRGNV